MESASGLGESLDQKCLHRSGRCNSRLRVLGLQAAVSKTGGRQRVGKSAVVDTPGPPILAGREQVATEHRTGGTLWLVFVEAGVAEAGTPSSSSVETSAVQSGPSAGATSAPADAVLAVGEGIARIPAVAVISVDDGAAQAAGFTGCSRRRRPCGYRVLTAATGSGLPWKKKKVDRAPQREVNFCAW